MEVCYSIAFAMSFDPDYRLKWVSRTSIPYEYWKKLTWEEMGRDQ